MANAENFPYETRLNILCQPLELIDERALADACTYKWYNQTLCLVKRLRSSSRCGGRRISLAQTR